MHTPTGEIIGLSDSDFERLMRHDQSTRSYDKERKMVSLSTAEADELGPLPTEKRKGWMKNKPCICGSGKKFKRCCWSQFK